MARIMSVAIAELGVAHGHELEEEHEEESHQRDALGPRVRSDNARQTLIAQSLVCRGKKMDESSGDNDA